jgi:Ca-activated chloride channel homolog
MTSTRSIILACGLALMVAACGADGATDTTAGGWDDRFEATATTAASSGWDGETTGTTASAGGDPDDTFENPGVNDDRWTDEEALSTFALDVDTASYTLARRHLTEGRLPDPESVRVEEYINHFAQDYPVPNEGFSVTVDGGPTPFVGEDTRVLRIGLRAADVELRPPTNLVFVVDTSGSMAEGNRLEHVKQSLGMLTEGLNDDDTVTIVAFGSDARLVLSPTLGHRTDRILSAIDSLEPEGSTNFEAGLALAYGAAEELLSDRAATRVIVASDGVANVGLDDPESLVDMIRSAADRGVTLVTVGVGMDNYNDALLEQLANDGDGFYAYVDTRQEAEDLFVKDLTGTLVTVAEDARVQVQFDPDSVLEWRLIGYENRALDDESFRDDTVDAGEIGAGHTVTALYELRPGSACR